jgi:uncharacterized protein YcfJ
MYLIKSNRLLLAVAISVSFMSGCAETQTQKGALIGGAGGALVGQAIGHDTKATLIGAAVGAAGGALIGNEMDKKDAQRTYYRDEYGNLYYVDNSGKRHYR